MYPIPPSEQPVISTTWDIETALLCVAELQVAGRREEPQCISIVCESAANNCTLVQSRGLVGYMISPPFCRASNPAANKAHWQTDMRSR